MKFKIIMTHKQNPSTVNESIQDLADQAAVEEFIINNPGTFSEYDWVIAPHVAVPAPVSPRQLRLGLLALGVTEAMVDTAIAGLSSPDKEQAQIAWKFSTYYKRDVALVAAIGVLLSMNSEQLDALWVSASGL